MSTFEISSALIGKQHHYLINVKEGFTLWDFCSDLMGEGMYCHDASWKASNTFFDKDNIAAGATIIVPTKFSNYLNRYLLNKNTAKPSNKRFIIHDYNSYKEGNNPFYRIGLGESPKRSVYLDFNRIESVDLSSNDSVTFVMQSGKEYTFNYLNEDVQKRFETTLALFFSHKH